jgi:WD40 repeat protein
MNEDQEVDIQYVDDDIIAAMDEEAYGDEDPNDFETFNEEEFGEGDQYEEG